MDEMRLWFWALSGIRAAIDTDSESKFSLKEEARAIFTLMDNKSAKQEFLKEYSFLKSFYEEVRE